MSSLFLFLPSFFIVAVVKTALEALEYLSQCAPGRVEMSRELGLKVTLEKIVNS